MFKLRTYIVVIVLALSGAIISSKVLYAQTNIISITPSDSSVSAASIYTIVFSTATQLDSISDEIVVGFPTGFNVAGAGVDAAGTVTQSGTDPQFNAVESGATTVVLDIQAAEPAGIQTIVLTGIVNPATAQNGISLGVSTRLDGNTPVDGDDPTPPVFNVVGTLTLTAGATPIDTNALVLLDGTGGTSLELTAFRLTTAGENVPIDTIRITPTFTGMTTAEISNLDIYLDDGSGGGTAGDGIINGAESSIASAPVEDQDSGVSVPVDVTHTITSGSTDNFIVTADFTGGVSANHTARVDIDNAAGIITGNGSISNSKPVKSGTAITGFTHTVTGYTNINDVSFENPGVSQTGTVSITFDTKTDLADGSDEFVITFPGGFDLSSVSVEAATNTVSGADPSVNAGKTSGQVVTLVTGAAENAGTHTIVLGDIINPGTVQNDITLDVHTQTSSGDLIDSTDVSPVSFDIVGTLTIETAAVPIDTNVLKQADGTGGNSLVVTTFKLTAAGENAPIDSIILIPRFGGMTAGEISAITIYKDDDNDGILDGGELQITSGAKDDNGSGNLLTFFIPAYTQSTAASSNFMVTADIAGTVSANDSIRVDVDSTAHWTLGTGPVTGATIQGAGDSLLGWTHIVTDSVNLTKTALSNTGVSSTGSDTIVFTTTTNLKYGDEIVISYPLLAGLDASSAAVNAAGTVTPSGTDPVKNAGESDATTVVLTVQKKENAGQYTIVLGNVTNPSSIQNDISLSVTTRTGANDLIDAADTTPDTFDVTAILTLEASPSAIDTNVLKQKHLDGVTNQVFTKFRLTAAGEDVPIDTMLVTPYFSGITSDTLYNIDIYVDNNGDGIVNGGDTSITSTLGPVEDNGNGTPVKIPSPDFLLSGTKDFTVTASLSSAITASEQLRIDVNQAADFIIRPGAVTSYAEKIGTAITGWTHTVSDSINTTHVGLSNPGVSRTSTDTITFTTMTNLETNNRIVVVFPAGFNASGASVDAATTTPSGSDPILVSATPTTITVRSPSGYSNGDFTLVLNNVVNPSSFQDEISVAVYTQTAAGDLIDREDTTPATFDVVATLTIDAATVPIDTNVLKLKHLVGGDNLVFTTFKLTAAGEDVPVTEFSVTPVFSGMTGAEISNLGIYLDNGAGGGTADDGIVNGTETFVSGTGFRDESGSGNPVTFNSTYTLTQTNSANFIVLATIANTVTVNDSFRLDLDFNGFQVGVGAGTGSEAELVGTGITGFQHFVSDTSSIGFITNSNTGVGRTSSYTISFNTSTNMASDDEIVIVFPAGFDASGFSVNAATTTQSGSLPVKNAGETNATTAVLDISAFEPAGTFSIVIDGVVNPSTVMNDTTLIVYTRTDANDLIDELGVSQATFDVGATLTLTAADNPIDTINLKQTEGNGAVRRELTTFKLSAAGENVPVNSIQVTPVFTGITAGELSNLDIYLDNGAGGGTAGNGIIDGGEVSVTTGAVDDVGSGNPVTINLNSFTHIPGDSCFIIVADLAGSISANDSLQINVDAAANISVGNGPVTGIPAERVGSTLTGFNHTVTDTATITGVTLQYPGFGRTSRYDITFQTNTRLENGNEEIVMVFPAGINPQTAAINNAASVTQSGSDPVISGESAGQNLVFTISAPEDAGTHVISMDNITNPGTVQDDIQIEVYTRTAANDLIDAAAGQHASFDVTGKVTLSTATTPVDSNTLAFIDGTGGNKKVMTAFKLKAEGENFKIDQLNVVPFFTGMETADIYDIDLYLDNGAGGGTAANGKIDGAESSVTMAKADDSGSGNAVTLTLNNHTLPVGAYNYVLVASFTGGVAANDEIRFDVADSSAIVSSAGSVTGSFAEVFGDTVSGYTHRVGGAVNVNEVTLEKTGFGKTGYVSITVSTKTDLDNPGDEIVLIFPSGFDLSNAGVNAATTTQSGTDPSVNAIETYGDTIVLDVGAPEPAGMHTIVLSGVKNPSVIQNDINLNVSTRLDNNNPVDKIDESPAMFDVTGIITLGEGDSVITINNLGSLAEIGGTNVPLTTFKLTTAQEGFTLDSIKIKPVFYGMTPGELYDLNVYLDNGAGGGTAANGEIDGTEAPITQSAMNDNGSENTVTFRIPSHTISSGSNNYIICASFQNTVNVDDSIYVMIDSSMIYASAGTVTDGQSYVAGDSVKGLTHVVDTRFNVNSITPTSPGFGDTTSMIIKLRTSIPLPAAGDEIVIIFPDTLDISDISLNSSTTTPGGTLPSVDTIKSSGQQIVLNVAAPEPQGTYNLIFNDIVNPDTIVKNLTCSIFTRKDDGTVLAAEDETPAAFSIVGKVYLSEAPAPVLQNKLEAIAKTGGKKIPLTAFSLETAGEGAVIDTIWVTPVFNPFQSRNVSNIDIYLDNGAETSGIAGNGLIDGNEKSVAVAPVNDNGGSVPVPVELTGQNLDLFERRNYVIAADFTSTMGALETIRIDIDSAYTAIRGTGSVTEASVYGVGDGITGYTHTVPGLQLPSLADTTISEAQKLELTISGPFTELPGRAFSAQGLPEGAYLDYQTGSFSWTPNLYQAGSYRITFTVSTQSSSDSRTITVTVRETDILTDLVHGDSTYFSLGRTDSLWVKTTGLYTLHRVISTPLSVDNTKYIIVRRPGLEHFTSQQIYNHPSAVEFKVGDYESGFTFNDSVLITVEYKDFEIVSNERNMRIHWWDDSNGTWKRVMSSHEINVMNNTLSAQIDHFTIFAAIEVADTLHTPEIGDSWNMISISVEPEITNPISFFSFFIEPFRFERTNSNLYEFRESTNSWELPSSIVNGNGYVLFGWDETTPLNVEGLEVTGEITRTLSYTNNNGWNLIGNPYLIDLDWENACSRTNVDDYYYYWTGTEYRYYPGGGLTELIPPWRGFFIRANAADAAIAMEHPGIAKKGSRNDELPTIDWKIRISAQSLSDGTIKDTQNYIGISGNASQEYDNMDVFKLVPLNDTYLSLSFPHNGWSKNPAPYTQDIRPLNRDEILWDFEIITNKSDDDIELDFELPENVPPEYEIYILDRDRNNRKIDIKTFSSYTYHTNKLTLKKTADIFNGNLDNPADFSKTASGAHDTRHFTAILKKIKKKEQIPESCIFEYGIPEEGHVAIEIYNILGQKIKTLVNDIKTAGFHKIIWHGNDNSGRNVASGMYICRMRTGSMVKSKKIIMLK